MLAIQDLLRQAPLPDARLNARALQLAKAIVEGQASATTGAQGVGHKEPWAHTVGAFRFFNNPHVTLPALYQPCQVGLTQLLGAGERCFVAHDISVLDYSHHDAKHDLISVGDGHGLGYQLYTALVLDSQGRPLGPAVQELRTTKGCLSSLSEHPLEFVDHMSQVERAVPALEALLPGRPIVHILDAEFDDLQLERFFFGGHRLFLIRAQHLKRRVLWHGQPTSLQQAVDQVALQPAGQVEHKGVTYQVGQGETQVLFNGQSYRGYAQKRQPPHSGTPIPIRVVVSELRAPGHPPLRWVLLTNLTDPVDQVVAAYIGRWKVERFFFLTKVGFRLEQWRQESGEGIARRLGVSMLAAMVLYQMQACSDDPQIQQVLVDVAKLGGWLGRKRDRMGPIVLMRGMLLLLGMLTAIEEYGERRLRQLAQRVAGLFGL